MFKIGLFSAKKIQISVSMVRDFLFLLECTCILEDNVLLFLKVTLKKYLRLSLHVYMWQHNNNKAENIYKAELSNEMQEIKKSHNVPIYPKISAIDFF